MKYIRFDSLLPSATKFVKVMFLHVSVILSTGEGVWSRKGSGPGGVWSRGGLLQGVCSGGGGVGIPACTEADPPGEMATAAYGSHPTGMHSCFKGLFTLTEIDIRIVMVREAMSVQCNLNMLTVFVEPC